MSAEPEKREPPAEQPPGGAAGGPAPAGAAPEELAAERERLAAERERLAAELAEKTRLHLRALADLENYRKRVARDRPGISAAAQRDMIGAILPALDALDLAIRHASSGAGPDGLIEGVKSARDALERALLAQGAERIPASGGYDPDLHHVQAVVERADLPAGTIIEELRPGYRVGGLVARHSEVVVAKRPAEKAGPAPAEKPETDKPDEA